MKRAILNISIVAAATAFMAGCNGKTPDFDACGQIDATEVTVSAESNGRIVKLDIEEGDRLSKGECRGHIDTVQISLQRDELVLRRKSAEIKRVDIECQMEAQYAKLDNLDMELRRASDLLAKDAGTQKQVDDLTSEIAILKGQIAAAEQNYRQNNASVESEINTIGVQIAQAEDKPEIHRDRLVTVAHRHLAVIFQRNAQLRTSLQIEACARKEFQEHRNIQVVLTYLQTFFNSIPAIVSDIQVVPVQTAHGIKQLALHIQPFINLISGGNTHIETSEIRGVVQICFREIHL